MGEQAYVNNESVFGCFFADPDHQVSITFEEHAEIALAVGPQQASPTKSELKAPKELDCFSF